MSSGLLELQKFTAVSKYARWLEDKQRRETWLETTGRFRGMMLERFPGLKTEIDWAFDGVDKLEVLGSQRALQFSGHPINQHNARIYNCSGSYCDRLRFFPEAFYLLLCGCGVGFSVQEHHIQHLPRFSRKRLAGVGLPWKQYVIPDTIEGWADAHAVLLSSFHEEPIRGFEEYHDCNVDFVFDKIRPEGANLSFGIGVAPGPKPLSLSLSRNRKLLLRAISEGLEKFNSIYAFDYAMHMADAVVSGGVRRAATICVFDLWDQLMATSKTGNWLETNPQRQRANISSSLLRGHVSFESFWKLVQSTREFGEPGFYWTSHPDMLPNPCVEIGFWAKLALTPDHPEWEAILRDYQGPRHKVCELSGWQFCNLSTINGKTIRNTLDFYERCQKAAFIGVLQKTFTKFPYLGRVSELIAEREALLGVSIAGIMHHPEILLDPDIQREGVRLVKDVDRVYSAKIGVNVAARGTCIKPDGNSASLLGSYSGIGPGKFRRGFRIARAGVNEAPYQHFKSINPQACEPVLHEHGGKNTDVIRFCVEYEGILEDDLSAVDMLKAVKSTYINWVCEGKVRELCTKEWLSHNVSNTVRVRPDEWETVARFIFDNQDFFAGVSLISTYGDRDFAQAPFTTVYEDHEIEEMYGHEAWLSGFTLGLCGEEYFGHLWTACEILLGQRTIQQPNDEQAAWLKQSKNFADQMFDGDVTKATYCMKDIYNNGLWKNLKKSYKPVDYSQMHEETNGTKLGAELACAGGACEL